MIDQTSPLGFVEVDQAATASSGASSGVFNLIVTQAQGIVMFIQDAAASAVAGATLITYLQTSANNSTWSNINYPNGTQIVFPTVTNVAATGGAQAIYVDSAFLSNYTRTNSTPTGTNANFVNSVIAIYTQKNP